MIEHALALDGRLTKFRAVISDRPGGLARFCDLVASTGASVKQILHERAFAGADVATVELDCTVETKSRDHFNTLLQHLRTSGIACEATLYQPLR